ncbi:uncharacterized protein EHS24_000442 [Apiotrichum porosum]|uniref:BTB domain-containing protein n=1 Tax=Apiotrichum porosum TaxID=105984 RepID=A0A427Y9Z6_9TREE|nr:uncharacterized protein EHS24_000442 [Apiotrichum porosum]RSH87922.1 hypothetical protein EHS24_000442 [Apiotrichum porosum]
MRPNPTINVSFGHFSTISLSRKMLRFHPDFTTPLNGLILQASDGLCFRFSRHTLVGISSFFEDICSLPTPPDSDGDEIILPFPTIGSAALACSLHILKAMLSNYPPFDPVPAPPFELKLLEEVFTFADAYDVPVILGSILLQALKTHQADSATIFTVAAVTGCKYTMAEMSTKLLTHESEFNANAWWAATLERKEPLIHAAVANMYFAWHTFCRDFRRDIFSPPPTRRRLLRFLPQSLFNYWHLRTVPVPKNFEEKFKHSPSDPWLLQSTRIPRWCWSCNEAEIRNVRCRWTSFIPSSAWKITF